VKLRCGVRWLRASRVAIAWLVPGAALAFGQVEDRVCVLCHAEAKSQVPAEHASHSELACVDCHVALAAWDPVAESDHAEHLPKVNCTPCHADQARALSRSVHRASSPADARPYPKCVSCHGAQHGRKLLEHSSAAERKQAVVESCSACHEADAQSFASTAHASRLESEASGPSCAECHGAHDILDPSGSQAQESARCETCHTTSRASLHRAAGDAPPEVTCLECHAGHGSKAKGTAVAHRSACSSCHGIVHSGSLPANADCATCHSFHWEVAIDGTAAPRREPPACSTCHAEATAKLDDTVHAHMRASCTQCHARDESSPCAEKLARSVDCSRCHERANASWLESPHSVNPGNGHVAASCVNCHGTHEVRRSDDPKSSTYPIHLPDTCEACHKRDPTPEHPAPAGDKVERYETSVHGRALRVDGLIVTATCASCHGGHDIRKPEDARAPTSRRNLPPTCGACHAGILTNYLEGVHGRAFLDGSADVPVCNDCHREHAVEDPAMAGSSVSSALVAETCARCHADDELGARHDLESSVRKSWGASYHGIATALGAEKAANCASCHGFHDVFDSSDPRSSVHPANLDRTCGGCHAGAGAAFAKVPVHSVVDEARNPVPFYVEVVYTVLVVGVIGAFVLFILFDLFARLRLRWGWGPRETEHVEKSEWPDEDQLVARRETFRRMGVHGRLQHGVLIASFCLLVLTGLPVFLHDVSWMRSVIDLEGGFELRSRLHRAAAFALIGLSVWHLAVLAIAPEARRWVRSMLITPRDVREFVQEMLFDVGLGPKLARLPLYGRLAARFEWLRGDRRPALGRYGLVEKLEYGAVAWGNLVMIATGAILWRPDWFLDWMPVWTFDVCRVVHGFEATLAFLAIVVWHMYHVHLRPEVFPMSRVWLSGRISRAELRHHHPREYLALLRERRTTAARQASAPVVPPERETEHVPASHPTRR
jgi:cytochrome b subunit of formate dehydrogenase